jgi:SAM-dependent methyltransferase
MESPPPPSSWIVAWAGLIPAGAAVLDVAAGGGRHTRYLRARGHPVTAIDRDVSRLSDLAFDPSIEVLQADLESGGAWPLQGRRFGGIVVTNYLHRPLFAHLVDGLADGGVLLYETFMVGQARFGGPSNPDFLLQDGELLDRLRPPLHVVAYEARMISEPRPALVQRIAARA